MLQAEGYPPEIVEGAQRVVRELDDARSLAKQIGIRHVVIDTEEFASESYTRNAPDRCYHCKTELYARLHERLNELDVGVIVNGANVEDLGDYRPGLQAAKEHSVLSPLADCGFTKDSKDARTCFTPVPSKRSL